MNGLLWIAQIVLAATFLFTGVSKLFSYDRLMDVLELRSKGRPTGISRGLAACIGVAEIAGAMGVVMPGGWLPMGLAHEHLLVISAAAGLALIMVLAGIYHVRRQEFAAPAVTLFLLALFIIVGRWPR